MMNNTEDKTIPQQYWYYTYQWKQFDGTWNSSSDTFKGTFVDLINFSRQLKYKRTLMYVRELTEFEYDQIKKMIE